MMMETVPSGTILHGRYRIEHVLGSGGFGHVYLAIDLNSNQQFAIKEYFVTGTSGQAQLQHEARVLSQLHHPNLPAFHEAFNERGHYFVVLSYIEGTDLTDHIRAARARNEAIPLLQVLGWVLSVCDAVNFLHTQQPVVIHRDIKPDNIRIMSNGTAILVDLGNAKATADGARTLFFIRHQGTPGYAPQEQYPGGTGTDVRSDVYALGGTLFFALTAHEPPSVSTRNQSIQQGQPDLPSLQEQLANNPPEDIPESQPGRQFRANAQRAAKPAKHLRHLAQLGQLPPDVLQQLNNIIARAMAMRPRDRYQSVADFGSDLRRVIAAIPVAAPPASRPIDPNSTQPDLPLLYDAIQKARENAGLTQAAPGVSNNPVPAISPMPPSEPAQTNVCPRCGTSLLPKASYCPSCGTAVSGNTFKAGSNTLPSSSASKDSEGQTPVSRDMTRDKTMVVRPQAKAQVQTQLPSFKSSSPNGNTHAATAPSASIAQMTPLPQKAQMSATVAPAPPSNNIKQPSRKKGMQIDLRILIIVAVLLLLIIIVILLVLNLSHGHFGHALHSLPLWSSIAGQGPHYERYISFSITSSTAFALTGLRSCRPGITPFTGLA